MKLTQFQFNLPSSLISKFPAKNRDESKLMVIHKDTGVIEDRMFTDIHEYFDDKDVFVVNNTKVFPARLFARKEKTNAKIEVFLQRELNREIRMWDTLVDPARKIRVGNKLYFGNNQEISAEVVDNTTSRGRTLRFIYDGSQEAFEKRLKELGELPIPTKILGRKVNEIDTERFQTVYSKVEGAVAPPAAGLHFSLDLIKKLEIQGIQFAQLTHCISVGTFRVVDVEDLTKHKMDAESFTIDQTCCNVVNKAKKNNHRICSIGTTTMRAMESSYSTQNLLIPQEKGWTNLFIHPPYDFHIADSLLTGFHLPKTSLLVLACSFGGYGLIMEAYQKAIKDKYRFFTYGDAMLIL